MSLPISVGIVGAGGIAASMHIPTLLAMPECRIAWMMDFVPERARALAKVNGLNALPIPARIEDAPACDAVLLALPLPPRGGYFDALLPLPSAILAEKPMLNTAAEHRAIVEIFAPWRVSVGYQRRHYASSRMLRSIIASGALGRLTGMRIAEGARTTRTGGTGFYMDAPVAQGGGFVKNLGCHSLDLAQWLVAATGFEMIERRIDWDGDTDRRAAARIRLKNVMGISGHDVDLDWTVSSIDAQSNAMEFRFESASLTCPMVPSDTLQLLDSSNRPLAILQTASAGGAQTVGQACCLEWRDVVAAIASRTEVPTSARSTLLTAEIMDALLD